MPGTPIDTKYWRLAGAGFEFAAIVGVCGYLGYKADERWGLSPWGLIGGVGIGFAAGLYMLIKEAYRLMAQLDDKEQNSEPGGGKTK
jgi:F0F1-type ATP synthase assembly protein I